MKGIPIKDLFGVPKEHIGRRLEDILEDARRLDKVLEKFEQIGFGGDKYYRYEKEYKGNYFFVLDYSFNKKQFYLQTTEIDRCQNFENVFMPIDLELAKKLVDTVEGLLKDLETHNEN